MARFELLDCTLRDGGYINDWKFGRRGIKSIINYLEQSHVDIIECGFLEDKTYNPDVSVFSDIQQIIPFITPKKENTMYVAMIALGDIDPDSIPVYDGKSIDGIRITFHKDQWEEEKEVALKLMEKGYKVFIQPVGTTTYTDIELIELINKVNEIEPYAFYIVDTLGIMDVKQITRLFYIIENNLLTHIKIGFHSHNNLQLSFSNAQALLKLNAVHDIIIDCSIFGMGRGAGNLATELIAQYINDNRGWRYSITPMLSIIDEWLGSIYKATPWGYALPYYLAAINGCHPNYATYLMNKHTINIEAMSSIINEIPLEYRAIYNESLIEEIYIAFQKHDVDDTKALAYLKEVTKLKDIVILGSGASINTSQNEIKEYIKQNNSFIISVNFNPVEYDQDIIFMSNQKRLLEMEESDSMQMIKTSNLHSKSTHNHRVVNYSSLLGEGPEADNAGAMLIRLLSKVGVKRVVLAGFDGFKINGESNYFTDKMMSPFERQALKNKNIDIAAQLKSISKYVDIVFITPTEYKIGEFRSI